MNREFPTAPFWAMCTLEKEPCAEQGEVVVLERIQSATGQLLDIEVEAGADTKAFREGDVLFGKLRPYLRKFWLADKPGSASGDIHVYRAKQGVDPRYLAYLVGSDVFMGLADASSHGTKMPRVEWTKISQFWVPKPPLETQRQLAGFLDRETAEIDAMSADLDEMEVLLDERRAAIQSAALNNATGDITTIPLQAITQINSGETITAASIKDTGSYPVYGGNGLRGYTNTYTESVDRVLIGRQGALCGNIHLAEAPFFASEHALVVKPLIDVNLHWLAMTLEDQKLGQLSMAAAQPGITATGVGLQKINMPALEEQQRIVDEVVRNTGEIDLMLADIQELRALLAERRSALITAAVTGQIDIPGLTEAHDGEDH